MKRADFLKRLGIGLGAVVVAPRVLAEMPAKENGYNTPIQTENPYVKYGDYLKISTNIKASPEFFYDNEWTVCNVDDVRVMMKNLPPNWYK